MKRVALVFLLLFCASFLEGQNLPFSISCNAGISLVGNGPVFPGKKKRAASSTPDIRSELWCLSCDGVDDFASATASNLPTGNNARTLMGWVYDAAPSSTEDTIFIYGGTTSNGKSFGLTLGLSGANTVGVSLLGYHMYQSYSRSVGWKHFAVTLPAGGTLGSATIWVNGIALAGTKSYIGGNTNTTIDTGSAFFSIGDFGGTYFGSVIWPMNARFAEISVWNIDLTQAQIQSYMYTRLSGTETNLVRHYRVTDGSGLSLADTTSGAKTATLFNSPTWVSRDIP